MNPIALRWLTVLVVLASGCVHAQTMRMDSSSAAYPLSKALVEHFGRGGAAIKINIGESGTANALRRFCSGEAELAAVSRPIAKRELARCDAGGIKFVEVPIALDAITVVVNPRNTFASALTIAQLRSIWAPEAQGKIMRWNQVNPSFPDNPLKLYAPDARAEQGDYFNEAVLGAGRESRRDVTASADDDILVQAIARDVHALGYVPLAHYQSNRNKLKALAIGESQLVAEGEYQALTRALFLYVNAKDLRRPEVRAFAEHYVQQAGRVAQELDYIPLLEATYRVAEQRLRRETTGSLWGGTTPMGITLDGLHKRLSTQ